jgi:type II secretory pathway component GspD/PulD (secretin)
MPKALMLVLLFSLLCIPGRPGTCRAETAVIPVHYRSVAEVLPIVEGLLTPTGKVTFVDRVHSLVVTDSAESIQNVRNFLETFDTPPQQVRIRVKFDEQMNSGRRRIAGRGRVSGDEWSLSTGGKTEDGVDIRANDRKQGQQQTSEYVIVTTSGSPAYFFTGVDVPYRQHWTDLCRRHGACFDTVEYLRIETGMEIVPFIAGNRATIEITPRISRVQEGDPKGVIRFTESSTRLSVPLGQWVEIGGTNQAGKEVLSAILKSGSSKESSVLVMRIMVETF